MKKTLTFFLILLLVLFNLSHSAEKTEIPKEYGVYVKTPKKLVRLMPNIVFDEQGIYYIERLSPPRFLLKDVEYFIIFGDLKIEFLTFNPMVFFKYSLVGKQRFMFGRNIPIEVKQEKEKLYVVKPKEIIGRGYYSLWIEDSAWDFVIE